MAVFALIAPSLDPRLEEAVKAHFAEGDYYKITPEQFLVAAPRGLTTQQVSDLLGVGGGNVGRVMVLRVLNYTGWHSKDMWEWITTHRSPPAPPSAQEEPD
jgi:hypothetical protein